MPPRRDRVPVRPTGFRGRPRRCIMSKGGGALLLVAPVGLGTAWGLAPVGPGIALARDRPAGADPDTDGDGLSDFHETHKYRTDPRKKDTAGQGVPDGDWQQR